MSASWSGTSQAQESEIDMGAKGGGRESTCKFRGGPTGWPLRKLTASFSASVTGPSTSWSFWKDTEGRGALLRLRRPAGMPMASWCQREKLIGNFNVLSNVPVKFMLQVNLNRKQHKHVTLQGDHPSSSLTVRGAGDEEPVSPGGEAICWEGWPLDPEEAFAGEDDEEDETPGGESEEPHGGRPSERDWQPAARGQEKASWSMASALPSSPTA